MVDPVQTQDMMPEGFDGDVLHLREAAERMSDDIRTLAEAWKGMYQRERELLRISAEIAQGNGVSEVLDDIYDAFKPLIPFDRMGCALIDEDGTEVSTVWGRDDGVEMHLKVGYRAKLSETSLGQVAESGQPRIITDLAAYYREHPQSKPTRLVVAEGIRSSLTCPLRVAGQTVGFLFFSSLHPDTYHEQHQLTFERLAGMVSIQIHKSHLNEELMRANRELEQARSVLAHQATHDGLTGILNRAAIMRAGETAFAQAVRRQGIFTILMIDIDHFKQINDTYGHETGDEAIMLTADVMQSRLRAGDHLGRYGGEEFVMVPVVSSGREALTLAERVRRSVSDAEVRTSAGTLAVTVSIGVCAREPGPGDDLATFVREADAAMYEAKRSGRNRCVLARSPGAR